MKNNNAWNADAEAALMGFAIPISSKAHLKYLIRYTLSVLQDCYNYEVESKTEEVFNNAWNRYNSEDLAVRYFTINSTPFGVLFTFVRDTERIISPDGVLSWVENIDAPDCSELGYTFFEIRYGKVVRIA